MAQKKASVYWSFLYFKDTERTEKNSSWTWSGMNADRSEEKPTGGGRQRMKPAWKEQTGGLREVGKSKMAQKNASVYWSFLYFKDTERTEKNCSWTWSGMNADRREEKPTERKSTELIARICAIWQSVTGFRSSEGSTIDSLTTEILNKFFYLPYCEKRA